MATKLQILQDHCHKFEKSLKGCQDPDEADRLRHEACEDLGKMCSSDTMQEMLGEHAQELIRQRFGWSLQRAEAVEP